MDLPTADEPVKLIQGNCLESLRRLPDGCVHCCVTSPPYWGGVRDYGAAGQLGLEREPADYVAAMSAVFSEVRRVLRSDGTLWLNVGDVYAASGKGGGGSAGSRGSWATVRGRKGFRMPPTGYKMKDLTLAPFQLADRLRRDGWYLRSTVIWEKPAAGEPMRADRPSVSHEYLFLFSVAESYRCENPGGSWWGHSVWKIQPDLSSFHPATMPDELARRCVISSTRSGDVVLDPFAGSGTTLAVAVEEGRQAVGCELNPEYVALARNRIGRVTPTLFAGVQP